MYSFGRNIFKGHASELPPLFALNDKDLTIRDGKLCHSKTFGVLAPFQQILDRALE